MNVEGFKAICEPNKHDLYSWMASQLTSYYGKANVIATGTYLFCVGNCAPMLCAHMDTVHKRSPKTFIATEKQISSPQGIGGDDRCGIYAILSILKNLEPIGMKPFLFFSTDEEVGGASTKQAAQDVKHLIAPVGFLIEFDRANSVDSVYYQSDNKEFKQKIDSYGFVEANGSFTDICTLGEAWDLAGVNLSVGYYNPHQLSEYVVFEQLENTIEKATKIVRESKPDVIYPFCKKKTVSFPKYNQEIYFIGDEVYTRNLTYAYATSKLSGNSVCQIPAMTFLDVGKVEGMSLRVEYQGKNVWIPDKSVYLCYDTKYNR